MCLVVILVVHQHVSMEIKHSHKDRCRNILLFSEYWYYYVLFKDALFKFLVCK